MGDLNPTQVVASANRERRAQLLLAGAFILAAALIGLTLILTASNYTATLANNDNAVTSGDSAVTLRDSIDDDLGEYVQHVNREYDLANGKLRFDAVREAYADRLRDYHGERGRVVELPSTSFVTGVRVSQSSGNFGHPLIASRKDWTVAQSGSRLRNATFVVTNVAAGASDPFEFVLDGGSESWTLELHEPMGGGTDIIVGSQYAGATTKTDQCRYSSTPLIIDIDEATVNEQYCPALELATRIETPYKVHIKNGSSASGRYWMILDPDRGVTISPGSGYSQNGPFPSGQVDPVIYQADVAFRYFSPTVTYEADLAIAPGEIS